MAAKLDKASNRIAALFGGTATVKHKGRDKVELSVELDNGSKISITSNTDNLEDTITILGVTPEVPSFDKQFADATEFTPSESEINDTEEEFSELDIPDMDVSGIERHSEVAENNSTNTPATPIVIEEDDDEAQTEAKAQVQIDREKVIEPSKPITKIGLPVVLPPYSENNVCVVIDPIKGDAESNKSLIRSLEKLCPTKGNLTPKHNIALLVLLTEANKLTKIGYCDAVTADSIISKICANYDFVTVHRNYGTSAVYEL